MTNEHGQFARRVEKEQRAKRLRADWYTRAALQVYLEHCSPLFCDHRELLKPYDYLDGIREEDFQWGRRPNHLHAVAKV